ncbi:hydrogenase maturation protease [Rhodocaloribacter sp.]
MTVELTDTGYLHLPVDLAERYFPFDLLFAMVRGRELWLLPARGSGGGGLLLKRRNARGDRSVLVWEMLPDGVPPGPLPAVWDERQSALRVALPAPEPASSTR